MAKNTSIFTKNWSLKLVQIKLKENAMFATFCTHMLGQGVFWLTRPQTNTPWLCQTLHLMLLLTTRLYINTTSTPGLHRTPHLRGSSVHSSALHRLSGEWWLVESGQHRGFSKHWTCREQHCSIFWWVRFGLRPFCKQEAAPLLPPGAGGGVTTLLWGFNQCSALVEGFDQFSTQEQGFHHSVCTSG